MKSNYRLNDVWSGISNAAQRRMNNSNLARTLAHETRKNKNNRMNNVNQELNMNNNNNMKPFTEIRRISMLITPCKRSATRGMEASIPSELRRSSMYNGFAQAVELLRSSKDGRQSVSPNCATLTRGYRRLTPSELFSAHKTLFPKFPKELQKNKVITGFCLILLFLSFPLHAQQGGVSSVSASVNPAQASLAFDANASTGWQLGANDLRNEQSLMLALQTPGDVSELQIDATGITARDIQRFIEIYVTYDPMNLGEAVNFTVKGNRVFSFAFPPKYGAHVKIVFKGGIVSAAVTINEISVLYERRILAEKQTKIPCCP